MKNIFRLFSLTAMIFVCQIQNVYSFADIISLTASSGSNSDETIIRLSPEATCDFDGDWDALKLSNGGNTPDFYSNLNGYIYAINSVPKDFETFSVDLDLNVRFDGSYTISTHAINDTYDSTIIVTLEDKLLNTEKVLKENATYTFNASITDASDRFTLHFTKASPHMNLISGLNSKIEANQVAVEINSGYAFVSFQNVHAENAAVTLLTSDGKVVYQNENISTDLTTEISLNGNHTGVIYIITVVVDNNVISKKFYN